jgi:hypothetical protein
MTKSAKSGTDHVLFPSFGRSANPAVGGNNPVELKENVVCPCFSHG